MILDNVKRLCREHGTNITEVEKAVGIGTGSIYKWGKSSPSVNAAKLVADFNQDKTPVFLISAHEKPPLAVRR